MIDAENLVKQYGTRTAVDGVTFSVEPGTVLGFLGPNGAGKTTTIRMIAGYIFPTAGRIQVDGLDVSASPVAAQERIGYMPESAPLYREMTVAEFLHFMAEVRGLKKRERRDRVEAVIDQCFLRPVRNQTIDTLSKGYRQRTSMAQALLHDPPILLLDEPTEGLDPNQKQVVRKMIREMGQTKVIILCTHVLEEVEAVCSRVMIINEGRIVADNTPTELLQQSPFDQALSVEIEAEDVTVVEQCLQALPAVAETTREQAGGPRQIRLLVRPNDPGTMTTAVIHEIHQQGWRLHDLQPHRGSLEEVFRQLTHTSDTDVTPEPVGEGAT